MRTYEDASKSPELTWGRPPPAVQEGKVLPTFSCGNAAKNPANHRQDPSWQSQHLRRRRCRSRISGPSTSGGSCFAQRPRSSLATRFRLGRHDQADRRARIRTALSIAKRRCWFSWKESGYEAARAQVESTSHIGCPRIAQVLRIQTPHVTGPASSSVIGRPANLRASFIWP